VWHFNIEPATVGHGDTGEVPHAVDLVFADADMQGEHEVVLALSRNLACPTPAQVLFGSVGDQFRQSCGGR